MDESQGKTLFFANQNLDSLELKTCYANFYRLKSH